MNKLFATAVAAATALTLTAAHAAAPTAESAAAASGTVRIVTVDGPYAALTPVSGDQSLDIQARAGQNPAVVEALRAYNLTTSDVVDLGVFGGVINVYVQG